MIGGEDDASGDMDTLRDDFHWAEDTIVSTYTTLGNICLGVLIAVYVAATALGVLSRARRRAVVAV